MSSVLSKTDSDMGAVGSELFIPYVEDKTRSPTKSQIVLCLLRGVNEFKGKKSPQKTIHRHRNQPETIGASAPNVPGGGPFLSVRQISKASVLGQRGLENGLSGQYALFAGRETVGGVRHPGLMGWR